MIKYQDDTIAAIVTPIGEGGISVIRLSGPHAIDIADKRFRGKKNLLEAQSHTVHFGNFVDENENVLDEVLATVFKSPNTYTGEDVVEISCHGAMYIANKILETILQGGIRFAEPGEFTKRAFLNGKMDLTQAEAVADLIHSRAAASHQSSLKQLQGATSNRINKLRDKLLDICSLIELELDFSEEDIELVEGTKLIDTLHGVINESEELLNSFSEGRLIRDGVKVVICGEPNVGKSSLLNSLLDEDRAIVTDISGTTRDIIEESIIINGIIFRIVDTAGIRKTDNVIEKEGIRRTEEEVKDADILLQVFDIRSFYNEKVKKTIKSNDGCYKIIVWNKVDLLTTEELENMQGNSSENSMQISAITKKGLQQLKETMFTLTMKNSLTVQERNMILTNVRHKNLIQETKEYLNKCLQSSIDKMSGDIIAVDLRIAINKLGEITGEVTTDDILNNIFSKFCIGK
jgi:tRNA modification GTPase